MTSNHAINAEGKMVVRGESEESGEAPPARHLLALGFEVKRRDPTP